jgi:hypothetical protein
VPSAEAMAVACALNSKYFVFRTAEKEVASAGGSCPTFKIDCEVKFKLSPASAKKLGREYSKALKIYPRYSQKSRRWDLKLAVPRGSSHESFYSRAVGFTLLRRGGRQVVPSRAFEVDHKDARRGWDTRLCNLEILTRAEHKAKSKRDFRLLRRPAAAGS